MSYNVTRTITLSSTLSITRGDLDRWKGAHRYRLPEINPLYKFDRPTLTCEAGHKVSAGCFCSTCGGRVQGLDDLVEVREFPWSGMRSGDEDRLSAFVADLKGEAEVVRVWEGGDTIDAIVIRNGKVFKRKVRFVLEDDDQTT